MSAHNKGLGGTNQALNNRATNRQTEKVTIRNAVSTG